MFKTSRQNRMLVGLLLLAFLVLPFVVFAQTPADEPTAQATVIDVTPTVISTEDAPIVDEPVIDEPVDDPAEEPINTTELVTSVLQMIGIGFASLATLGVATVAGFTLVVRGWQQNPEMVRASETVGDAIPDPTQKIINEFSQRVEEFAKLLVEVSKYINEATDGIPASEKTEAGLTAESPSAYVMSLGNGQTIEVVPGSPAVIRPATSDQQDTKPVHIDNELPTDDVQIDDGDDS